MAKNTVHIRRTPPLFLDYWEGDVYTKSLTDWISELGLDPTREFTVRLGATGLETAEIVQEAAPTPDQIWKRHKAEKAKSGSVEAA